MDYINQQDWYKKSQQDNPGLIEVGDYSYGEIQLAVWDRSTKLRIGKFCQIAFGVNVYVGGEHDRKRISTYPFDILIGGNGAPDRFTKGDITIENDVWIGAQSIILSGSKIGSGAIIGAGSVIRKNTTIPPYSIALGNPIEVVGYRFKEHQIEQLLKIAWWEWPIEKIKEAMPLLRGNVDKFIEKYRE